MQSTLSTPAHPSLVRFFLLAYRSTGATATAAAAARRKRKATINRGDNTSTPPLPVTTNKLLLSPSRWKNRGLIIQGRVAPRHLPADAATRNSSFQEDTYLDRHRRFPRRGPVYT